MSASTLLGRPLWYELMTTDTSAAERFYTAVVGWTASPFEGGDYYTLLNRPGPVPIGGMMALPDELKAQGVPPHWMWYVGVDALDAALAHVESLGGAIVSHTVDIPNVGRMRVVKDRQGAPFALFEPSSPAQQPEALPELGDASWHELYTTDNADAMAFYHDLFGWKATEAMDMGEMGVYRMFGRDLGSLGGMMTKTPDMAQVPTSWLVYFRVPDVHTAAERVKANGGQVVHGPMEVPGGDWIVQAVDPQGGMFALHHRKA
ncbi:MAG: VOC family protein [Vicinamibacterales bacterium]